MNRWRVIIGLLSLLVLASALGVQAQEEPLVPAEEETLRRGWAQYTGFAEGQEIQNGQIVRLQDGEYSLADTPYDTRVYGVVNTTPAVSINYGAGPNAFPVVTNGTAEVLVSTANGEIAAGDYITTSEEAGVGMKANQAGFVIGTAEAPYATDGQAGIIPVTIDLKFVTQIDDDQPLTPRAFAKQLQDVATIGMRAFYSEPNTALRYLAAALIIIVSLTFAFLIFGRAAISGIISIGRNPLAKGAIFLAIGFNLSMAVVFALAGLALGFVVLAI